MSCRRFSPTLRRCRARSALRTGAAVMAAAQDPKLKDAMTEAATEADEQIVSPLFEFRN